MLLLGALHWGHSGPSLPFYYNIEAEKYRRLQERYFRQVVPWNRVINWQATPCQILVKPVRVCCDFSTFFLRFCSIKTLALPLFPPQEPTTKKTNKKPAPLFFLCSLFLFLCSLFQSQPFSSNSSVFQGI